MPSRRVNWPPASRGAKFRLSREVSTYGAISQEVCDRDDATTDAQRTSRRVAIGMLIGVAMICTIRLVLIREGY